MKKHKLIGPTLLPQHLQRASWLAMTTAMTLVSGWAHGQTTGAKAGVTDSARIEKTLSTLTRDEKVSLVGGASAFATASIDRLGVRGMRFADGPSGVRSNDGDEATAFPVGVTLASTWNPALVQQVGAAIGAETRHLGHQVLLGPNMNLVRSPLSGRNFETYGEDPYLAGRMGIGFVTGLQSVGVSASVKHFVGNEQETERNRGNSVIDARTLHEIYLKPFEMVIKQAHPWTLMTAYNRTNGTYMSENAPLVRDLLKNKWGYDGVVMSDWFGTHSINALPAGLDLEMPGPPMFLGASLRTALDLYQVPESAVDDAARRMLRLTERVGNFDNTPAIMAGPASTPAHRTLARQVAAQAITLLKNQGNVLPLDTAVRKLAVIGPNADAIVVQGGGSAQVIPSNLVSPLDAIRAQVGNAVAIQYEAGVNNELFTPAIDGRDFSTRADRAERGLQVSYWPNDRFAGKPAKVRTEQSIASLLLGNDVSLQGQGALSVRWQGYYWPRVTGEYEFELEYIRAAIAKAAGLTFGDVNATGKILLGDKVLVDSATAMVDAPTSGLFPSEIRRAKIKLTAGKPVKLQIDYAGRGLRMHSLRVGVNYPSSSIAAAVAAARNADVALVFVGSGSTAESEGRDRQSLELSGEQNQLIAAVVAANPRTVVVLHNGAPVTMPWVNQVPAIVEAWLPGQEGNLALADVLFGKVNPSGKLPVTFPERLQDAPSFPYYPGFRDAFYGEGLFMGYRYFDKREIKPLFAFGHGLSYTQFEYSGLQVPKNVPSGTATVSVEVKNSGTRAGAEVVQFYIGKTRCIEACVARQLKQFARVELQPGERKTVSVELPADAFMDYDVHNEQWQVLPGTYMVSVGSSSRDIRQRAELLVQ